ncbi:hypothetical protein ARMSODRAFT_1045664 [Armillaria solidipes]|uniref:Uncharacterized protein n=1 Tax=Armillaria solidipes TaxID=1076256 RepID=A0A2H3BMB5_9AGAR|nr:hypothetical protein ARMSODRAFT_1045664 [Armillaria solidipes]
MVRHVRAVGPAVPYWDLVPVTTPTPTPIIDTVSSSNRGPQYALSFLVSCPPRIMSFLRPENSPPESLIPILRGNITLPDEDLSQIQDAVFASEQAISHLAALLTGQCSQLLAEEASQLNERHKSLTQYVSNCRSLLAPIRRLPRDVLEIVFAFVPSSESSLNTRSAPWSLAHICYAWRDIVLSTPSLWAKIDICPPYTRGSMTILGRHLQLSGEYPLDISISYQDTFEEDNRGILSLILQHSTRWKRMQIKDVSRTEVDTVMSELSIVAGNLPLLEEVSFLSMGQLGSTYYDTEMLVAAPSLRRAWLLPFNRFRQIPLNANLTHFSGGVACLEDIQHIMKLPTLIECYLRLTVNDCLTRTTPLRNDRILRFSTSTPDILAKLTLPSLEELRLFDPCHSTPSLIAFFIRSSCNLKSLRISHFGYGNAHIPSYHLETLERLTIGACWEDVEMINSYSTLRQLIIRLPIYARPFQSEIKVVVTCLRNRLREGWMGRRVTSLRILCGRMDQGLDYLRALRVNGLDVLEGEGLQVCVYQEEAGTWLDD